MFENTPPDLNHQKYGFVLCIDHPSPATYIQLCNILLQKMRLLFEKNGRPY